MSTLEEQPAQPSIGLLQYLESGTNIAGADYTRFLDQALIAFAYFTLVWRDAAEFDDTAFNVRKDLARHQTNRRRAGHWPGTYISAKAPQATIISYRLDAAARRVLARPGSLFAWLAPAYPEDLAFYQRDGRLAFATCTRDRLAWAIDLTFGGLLPDHLNFMPERISTSGFAGFDYAA